MPKEIEKPVQEWMENPNVRRFVAESGISNISCHDPVSLKLLVSDINFIRRHVGIDKNHTIKTELSLPDISQVRQSLGLTDSKEDPLGRFDLLEV